MSTNRNYKKAALITLRLHGSPLMVERIVELAIETGELVTSGKTPENTMRARLSEDIRRNGKASLFIRTAPNKFGLREWNSLTEYKAKPMVKSSEELVVCISQKDIDEIGRFFGFTNDSTIISKLFNTDRLHIFDRSVVENNDDYKQLIAYVLLENENGEILSYRRGSYSTANKKLLEGAICIGFGGHVRKDDYNPKNGNYWLFPPNDLGTKAASIREIREELHFNKYDFWGTINNLQTIGLINDDSSPTGLRHLAIVLKAKLTSKFDIARFNHGSSSEKAIREITLRNVTNLWNNYYQLEFWSQLLCKNLFPEPEDLEKTFILPRRKKVLKGPISIVGEIATGKTVIANILHEKFNIPIISTRDCVSELIEEPDFAGKYRKTFSDKAYELISTNTGRKRLASKFLHEIKKSNSPLVIIDGIRNIEVNNILINKLNNYTTIFVDSPRDHSFQYYKRRIEERSSRSVTIDEFRKVRSHPVEKDVAWFKNRADVKIYNIGTLEELMDNIEEYFDV